MNEIFEKIYLTGIIPVVKIDDADKAVLLANALCNGGLPVAEVTFRTDAAEDAIKNICKNVPEMLVGAGTVLNTEQVDRAVNAGAKFIVTPGFNGKVVEYCVNKNISIIPGCPTTSDIETAIETGLKVVKFFPAENLGGIKMIKALSAPYSGIKFMPTGGINATNVKEYLDCDKIIACGGSWMVKDTLINNNEFDKIEKMTKEAVKVMLDFKFSHIAVNFENKKEATLIADLFASLFGFEKYETGVGYFCNSEVELINENGRGTKGHIAISTNNVDRAVNYLKNKGVKFDETTVKYDDKGRMKFIYLADEFGGFALHLCR